MNAAHHRLKLTLFGASTAALLLSGCGSSSEPAEDSAGATDNFPATITHVHGETVIHTPPERVASVGIGDTDVLLALGVQPALAAVWPGSTDTGIGEWSTPLIEGDPPTPLPDATTEFSIEEVAASEPDVIVAVNNAIDVERYTQLDSIAPTVLHSPDHEDWVLPWQDVTERVGQAVGKTDEAQTLVDDTEKTISTTADENPDLADKTAALVTVQDDNSLRVFSSNAARGQLLASLGLTVPEEIEKQFDDALYLDIAAENLSLLDVDILVVDNYEREERRLSKMPTFTDLDVVKNSNLVGLDAVTSDAVSMPNPVTIPFVLDSLVTEIRKTPAGQVR